MFRKAKEMQPTDTDLLVTGLVLGIDAVTFSGN